MRIRADIIKQSSIIALLRYSDFFLTLILLSRGATELNIFWGFLENNFYPIKFLYYCPNNPFFLSKIISKTLF